MKKLLAIAFVAATFFMTACSNSGESGTASSSSSGNSAGDKNIATVHAINDAISSGDVGKLDQYIAADGVDHSGENGKEIKGLDSIKASLKHMHDDYKDLKLTSIQDAAGGDYVFSLTNFKGTSTTASMGAPAGTNFDMTSVEVVKFNSDGKATDHWGYVSMNDAMKMMGGGNMNMMKKDTSMKKM